MPKPDVTQAEAIALLDRFKSEEEFQQWIITAAVQIGWSRELIYHTRYSRGSTKGFPDLVLCRPPRLIWAELKMPGKKLTEAQELWAWALKESGQEVYAWWPKDMDRILEVLS
tara:strand:- start:156 stop:494 length:339 start_codon:yes stop_codon:yes gene_type:complete